MSAVLSSEQRRAQRDRRFHGHDTPDAVEAAQARVAQREADEKLLAAQEEADARYAERMAAEKEAAGPALAKAKEDYLAIRALIEAHLDGYSFTAKIEAKIEAPASEEPQVLTKVVTREYSVRGLPELLRAGIEARRRYEAAWGLADKHGVADLRILPMRRGETFQFLHSYCASV